MKQRYHVFRRENGIFYSLDTLTKNWQSLETSDAETAQRLANALNEACKHPAEMGRCRGNKKSGPFCLAARTQTV
jgi:hypothetical protein